MRRREKLLCCCVQAARAGFSLTELLVVIAIVSIVMALLLPGLVMSRRHSQAAECVNNLRQIGFALENFAADNDDLIPEELMSDETFKEIMSAQGAGWSMFPTAYAADGDKKSMADYYEDKRVLRCPSMKTDEKWSYGMNGQVCSIIKRFRDIENPSQTPMVFDSEHKMGFHFSDLAMRHAGCAQVLYADTHVEPIYHDLLYAFNNTVRLPGTEGPGGTPGVDGIGGFAFDIEIRITGTPWDTAFCRFFDLEERLDERVHIDRRTGDPNEQTIPIGHFVLDPGKQLRDMTPAEIQSQEGRYFVTIDLRVTTTNPGGRPKDYTGGNPIFLGVNGGPWHQITALNKNKPQATVEITQHLINALYNLQAATEDGEDTGDDANDDDGDKDKK